MLFSCVLMIVSYSYIGKCVKLNSKPKALGPTTLKFLLSIAVDLITATFAPYFVSSLSNASTIENNTISCHVKTLDY